MTKEKSDCYGDEFLIFLQSISYSADSIHSRKDVFIRVPANSLNSTLAFWLILAYLFAVWAAVEDLFCLCGHVALDKVFLCVRSLGKCKEASRALVVAALGIAIAILNILRGVNGVQDLDRGVHLGNVVHGLLRATSGH